MDIARGVRVVQPPQDCSPSSSNGCNNGSNADTTSAAIRVDGNSEVFLRGGTIVQNNGPAMLVLVNSSADFSAATLTGNTGGILDCDNTAVVVTDLAPGALGSSGATCRRSQFRTNRHVSTPAFAIADSAAQKAAHDKYAKLATVH